MGLMEVFEKHPERRYIMFGGKGGLGKTTFSAATAYWLASQGKKVLVFSVDPQASLTDIFQKDIFGKGPVTFPLTCGTGSRCRTSTWWRSARRSAIPCSRWSRRWSAMSPGCR